jgi:hypothetical protein
MFSWLHRVSRVKPGVVWRRTASAGGCDRRSLSDGEAVPLRCGQPGLVEGLGHCHVGMRLQSRNEDVARADTARAGSGAVIGATLQLRLGRKLLVVPQTTDPHLGKIQVHLNRQLRNPPVAGGIARPASGELRPAVLPRCGHRSNSGSCVGRRRAHRDGGAVPAEPVRVAVRRQGHDGISAVNLDPRSTGLGDWSVPPDRAVKGVKAGTPGCRVKLVSPESGRP